MADLGKLYVQIVPSAQGVGGAITNILEPEASSAGNKAGSSFMSKMAMGFAGGAAVAGAALAGVTGAAVNGAKEFAAYGDNIDKMSQKMGMSAEAYQEWDAVMQHSGTSMAAMKSSMKTLANAAATGSDAFEQLGISQEQIASMSQEELFGATITALQNVEDETTRTYLAGKTLGKGATELGALLNTSAEDTQAMKDRVHELGGVLSDDAVKAAAAFQDNMQDMTTAMDGMKRNITASFLPGLNGIMQGITGLMAGDSGATAQLKEGISNLMTTVIGSIPQVADAAMQLIQAFVGAIIEVAPDLATTAWELVSNLVNGIMTALPELTLKGVDIISGLAENILANLPMLITTGFSMMQSLIGTIMQNLPTILGAGVTLIGRLASGIISNAPAIVGAMASGIARLLQTIAANLPQFLSQGIQLIARIVSGIIQSIPRVVATVPQIFSRVRSAFTSINWLSLGTNIINGIANGIRNGAQTVVNAAKNLAKNAFDAAKNFLGIHSPSTKFRWLADMSVEGFVLNMDKGVRPVVQTVQNVMDEAVGVGSRAIGSVMPAIAQPQVAAPVMAAAGGDYTIVVPVNIDGRQVARITAPYTQVELEKLNRNSRRREGDL